jgi:hypothetical protein
VATFEIPDDPSTVKLTFIVNAGDLLLGDAVSVNIVD